jgi:hypothetical protein
VGADLLALARQLAIVEANDKQPAIQAIGDQTP